MSTSVPTATGRSGFRQILTPLGSTKKRRDRNALEVPPQLRPNDIFSPRHPPNKKTKTDLLLPKPNLKTAAATATGEGNQNSKNNMVFAGYLAHEYLTRGTLMGRRWNPTAASLSGEKEKEVEKGGGDEDDDDDDDNDGMKIYNDLSCFVMGRISGVHITDVVNPTELNRWCVERRR